MMHKFTQLAIWLELFNWFIRLTARMLPCHGREEGSIPSWTAILDYLFINLKLNVMVEIAVGIVVLATIISNYSYLND